MQCQFKPRATQATTGDDWSAVFVHAGAGYHSVPNEPAHREACASSVNLSLLPFSSPDEEESCPI